VQGKTALIRADIEGLAMGVARRSGIVEALVEKGSRLLPGVGVVVKSQPVDVKDGGQLGNGLGGIERRLGWLAELLQFPDAGIRPLHDRDWLQFRLEDIDDGRAHLVPIECLGEDLEKDEVPVAIDDQAGELIGFTEHQAAGIGALLQHALTLPNGMAQALVEQCQPALMRQMRIGGYHAQRDLRGWAPQRSAQGKAAMIRHRDQSRFCFH